MTTKHATACGQRKTRIVAENQKQNILKKLLELTNN